MFKTRLLSGIALVIVALITITYGSWALTGILILVSLLGYLELTRACQVNTQEGEKSVYLYRKNGLEIAGILAIIAYYGAMLAGASQTILVMIVVLAFIATLFVYVFGYPKFHSNQVMSAYFAFLYAPVMLSFIYLTRDLEYGEYLVWLIFLASWGCDTCAYCVGMLFGKTIGNHKMSPKLSPKKSIEGAVGGVVGAALLGVLYAVLLVEKKIPDQNITWVFALICGVGALISMVGDLAASAIKRNHDIKDYGHCIPGHGGIMDRFDSVIVTAPVIYFLAVLILK